jgi:hypothetical protein
MKKIIYTLIAILGFAKTYAQAPLGIPYQAAARKANGQALTNTAIKVRFSILDSVAIGTVAFKETHTTTTNALGMFNLNVGMGTAITGTLAGVNWGNNAKFLQVELDTTATGNNYMLMGIQQLMSVPYALFSTSTSVLKPTQLIDTINNPAGNYVGQFATYKNNGNLYYWNGYVWNKIKIASCPEPTISNAGVNLNPLNYQVVQMNANTPIIGFGKWKLITGQGGIFLDETNPQSKFIGLPNTNYTLRWVISNNCDSSYSDININYQANIFFNQSGQWIVPDGIDSIQIEIFGGGGGGDNANVCPYHGCWIKGAGGGAGGYGTFYMNLNNYNSISFNVGSGGINNSDGGNTSCLGYIANGGKSASNNGIGGSSNCVINTNGGNGGGGGGGSNGGGAGFNGGYGINGIGSGGDGGLFIRGYGGSYAGQSGQSGKLIITPLN